MKKSLIALAALGAFAGAASAQSSVTLFGVADVGVRQVKNAGGDSLTTLSTDGLSSSRLGVRGVEDLGGGLQAGFWLESAVNPDNGTSNATRFWHRRSTVSLMGGFGEVRLGRDLTPTYLITLNNNVFTDIGVGAVTPTYSKHGSATYDTQSRADNMVSYLTPATLGGFYGQVSVAAGEGADGKKYMGGRAGYAAGPLDVSLGYGTTDRSNAAGDKFKVAGLGASYDFKVVKVSGSVVQNKLANAKQIVADVGAVIPVSAAGKVRLSVVRAEMKDSGDDANKFAVGYVHDLSKRTALYGTLGYVKNKGNAAYNTALVGVPATSARGDKSRGVEFGLRHSF